MDTLRHLWAIHHWLLPVLWIVHLSTIAAAAVLIATAGRYRSVLQSHFRVPGVTWIQVGGGLFMFASVAEITEHFLTDWIYIDRISPFNGLFYCGLVWAMTAIAYGLRQGRWVNLFLLASAIAAPLVYGAGNSKLPIILLQIPVLVVFMRHWWLVFQDRLILIYPVLAVGMTTSLAAVLVATRDQRWHAVISPFAALGVLTLCRIIQRGCAAAASREPSAAVQPAESITI